MRYYKWRNYKAPHTGIVHIHRPCGDGEFTLCGWSFDARYTEDGHETMVETDEPCNCELCISDANKLMPVLKYEMKRIKKGYTNG